MKIRSIAQACVLVAVAVNSVLVCMSSLLKWIELLVPVQTSAFAAKPLNNNMGSVFASFSTDAGLQPSRVPGERNGAEASSRSSLAHYSPWDASDMKASPSTRNVSILVELTGEFGNHLNHVAHGRAIQTMLWQDHGIASHLVLRRNSNEEKYQRTQRQLKRCFPNLAALDFHGPKSSSITSQKTLDRIQSTLLGQDQSNSLFMDGGSSFATTQTSVQDVVAFLKKREGDLFVHSATSSANSGVSSGSSSNSERLSTEHGVSFPFLSTHAMINREFMDRFYDDFRSFFQFDEEACCATGELPDPDVAVFHFRNFLGELKQGKKKGLEELSAHKVATELFTLPSSANSTQSIAIATRFPERKASKEYFDALEKEGFHVRWLTIKDDSSQSPPSAMHDFCAMRRTTELVGSVRSTFAVWGSLLGNPNGTARLYSVDSTSARKKNVQSGRPIFRTYNWTHPELQRRIHFELYESEDLVASAVK